MLEPMGFLVGFHPVEAQDIRQPALQQPVAARHGLGDREPAPRQDDLFPGCEPEVPGPGHALERLRHGRRRHLEVSRQAGPDHRAAAAGQVVDTLQVVFDRRRGGPGADRPGGASIFGLTHSAC